MLQKLAAVFTPAAVAAAAVAVVAPRTSDASTSDPSVSGAAETYGQYSLMFERSARQRFAGQTAAGQWAWTPLSATESDISWGAPRTWQPKSAEHFIHDGEWALLDGCKDGAGRQLTQVQRVTSEKIGDASRTNLTNIPSARGVSTTRSGTSPRTATAWTRPAPSNRRTAPPRSTSVTCRSGSRRTGRLERKRPQLLALPRRQTPRSARSTAQRPRNRGL